MHCGLSTPLSVRTESSKVTFPSSWALAAGAGRPPRIPGPSQDLAQLLSRRWGRSRWIKPRVKQELFLQAGRLSSERGVPGTSGSWELSPRLQTCTHGWRGCTQGCKSPLVVLCRGCQPLLLPFSSLFYTFSSNFLQVGINPGQGRMGGWQFWGTAATSFPVPGKPWEGGTVPYLDTG